MKYAILLLFLSFNFFISCSERKRDNEGGVSQVNILQNVPDQILEIIEILDDKIFDYTNTTSNKNRDSQAYYYADQNGTILSRIINNGNEIIIRKHLQRFQIYPSTRRPYINEINVFDEHNTNSNILFVLQGGDFVNTLEIAFIVNSEYNSESNWIKIEDDNGRIGWLDMDLNFDPYFEGTGSFVETIFTSEKEWTVIMLQGGLSYWETIDIRDKPGFMDSTVIFQLVNENREQLGIRYNAITRETDNINGRRPDHWLRITDSIGRVGWMFGGDGSLEGGGPKYDFPENIVHFMFNLP